MLKEVVFLGGARTPMGEYSGVLKDMTANELGALAAAEALRRSGIEAGSIDHAVFGNALQTSRDAIYRPAIGSIAQETSRTTRSTLPKQ